MKINIDNDRRRESWRKFLAEADGPMLQIGTHRGKRAREDAVTVDYYDAEAELQIDVMELNRGHKMLPQFGSCCCHAILEHVPDPRRALESMAFCLQPGSLFHIEAPWNQPLHYSGEWRDYWRFSEFGLDNMLTAAGFKVLSGGYFGKEDYAAVWMTGVLV